MESEKYIGHAVKATTGCSCSSCKQEENIFLFFDDADAIKAMQAAEGFAKDKILRSQYSSTGIYHIHKFEYEKLPDGRKIIGNYITTDSTELVTAMNSETSFIESQMDYKVLATYGEYLKSSSW